MKKPTARWLLGVVQVQVLLGQSLRLVREKAVVALGLVQDEGLDHEIAPASFGEAAEALGWAVDYPADNGHQGALRSTSVDRLLEPGGYVRPLAPVVIGDDHLVLRGLVDLEEICVKLGVLSWRAGGFRKIAIELAKLA